MIITSTRIRGGKFYGARPDAYFNLVTLLLPANGYSNYFDGTGTAATNLNQTSNLYVGADRTGGSPMKGYIQDLRITRGVARYTSNFNVPTQPFPTQ